MKTKITEETRNESPAPGPILPVCWTKKRRSSRQRKASKPKRPSKSLGSLAKLAKAHCWLAMATFKPDWTTSETQSNACQRFLAGLLRRELRGKQIGFLLVREFGTGRGVYHLTDRSHFHAVLTDRLPKGLANRIRRLFLNRCGLKKDPSRTFDYREHTLDGEPTFGKYVSKITKHKIDVKHPPSTWNYKKLIRLYHSGYLAKDSHQNYMHLLAS